MLTHIRSEQDAWDYLFRCWSDPDYGNERPVVFDRCVLSVRLDPGNGKADWKINRAIGLLQRHVNMIYKLAKCGDPYARITETERERLSLAIEIGIGSTILGNDITKSLSAIQSALPAHWSPRTRSIVTVGAFLAIVSLPFIQEYREYRAAVDTAQITAAASILMADRTARANIQIAQIHANAQIAVARQEANSTKATATLNGLDRTKPILVDVAAVVLAQLAQTDPSNVVRFAASDLVSWRPALLELAPYSGTIRWNESRPIPAPTAKAIAQSARADATAQRSAVKKKGQRGIIDTPWMTEVLRTHQAPGAMRLGVSDA